MSERTLRKVRSGYVVSDQMDKTRVVSVETLYRHRMYKKTMKKTTRYMVDDPSNESKTGDLVKIMETRPLSKTKRWRVVEIIERAK